MSLRDVVWSCLNVLFLDRNSNKITLVNRKLVAMTKLRSGFFFHFYNYIYLYSIYIPSQNSAKSTQWFWRRSWFCYFWIFSNGGHLWYSTQLNFTISRPCSQVMPHVKFENCRSSGFIEYVWRFGFKCWRTTDDARTGCWLVGFNITHWYENSSL